MFRTIMVPLDGSPAAECALPWAAHLARHAQGNLRLVRVFIPPTPIVGEGSLLYEPSLYDDITSIERDYLVKVAERLSGPAGGIPVTTDLVDADDSVSGVLQTFADSNAVDLAVMTTHGRGPYARFWLGSVADEFLRRWHGPTLLVRTTSGAEQTAAAAPRVGRILVPLDGSDLAERALEPAVRFGKLFAADLTLLLVLDAVEDVRMLARRCGASVGNDAKLEAVLPVARQYLAQVAERVSGPGPKASSLLVEHGRAAEEILREASDPGTMIALATHGHGGVTRMLHGSVADKIIRGASGPVLVVRPKTNTP